MKILTIKCFTFVCIASTRFTPSHGAVRFVDVSTVGYNDVDGFQLEGYKAEPDNRTTVGELIPAVVILPDWDGVNAYEKQRATMLTDMGYLSFAADIYGINDHEVEDGDRRKELASFYRANVTLYVQRIKAAITLVKSFDGVDPNNVALIGYCFGGTGVLDYALYGEDDVKALVSFHGGLSYIPPGGPSIMPKLLVLSGGDDDTSSDVIDLENTLSTANASWEISRYSGVDHAFTVFSDNRYHLWADGRSWDSMSKFLSDAFGIKPFEGTKMPEFDVVAINYTDVDETSLMGYLSLPKNMKTNTTTPAVIILPNWDGVNSYEKERGTMLAEAGYIAFAADIFGSDLQNVTEFLDRSNLTSLYRDNPQLFVQRIQAAVDLVKTFPEVDVEHIAVIGYCFGGSGVLEYAFSGTTDILAVVSFHGGHEELPQPMVNIQPYVLVLSGGIDDAHGNQTMMELALNERNATWEISRYAMVGHGYTDWNANAYNPVADTRSWDSMMNLFANVMPVDGNVMVFEKTSFADENTTDESNTASGCGCHSNVIFILSAIFVFTASLSACAI